MFCSMCLDGNDKNETPLRGLNFVGIKFVSDGGSDRGGGWSNLTILVVHKNKFRSCHKSKLRD